MSRLDLHLQEGFASQSEREDPFIDDTEVRVIRIRVAGLRPGRFYRLGGRPRTFFRADRAGAVEILFSEASDIRVDLLPLV